MDWGLALAVLAGLILLSEAGLALGSKALWRSLGRLELVDAALEDDHRAALGGARQAKATLLGDSVLYGSALREKSPGPWRQGSLGQALQDRFAARGMASLELSGDGLYPADLYALWSDYRRMEDGPVLVELNVRMFAAEPGNSATAYSRRFLAPGHQPDAADRVSRVSRLFRYCRLASHLLWQPSRIQKLTALLDRSFPPAPKPDADEGLGDALLNMKIQPYYSAPAMAEGHAGLQALERLAKALQAHGGQVLVFLTPQNGERIADVVDSATYQANRRKVAALFKAHGLKYLDLADLMPAQGAFLDHCHLDAAGNAWLAERLLRELP